MGAYGFYRNWGCGKQETWTSNILNPEDQWVSFVVVIVLLHSQHQRVRENFESLLKGNMDRH